jgi:hypothetical protein
MFVILSTRNRITTTTLLFAGHIRDSMEAMFFEENDVHTTLHRKSNSGSKDMFRGETRIHKGVISRDILIKVTKNY